MSLLRTTISAVVLLALALGYAASQFAFFSGQAPTYSATADHLPVRLFAGIVLLVAIVLAFVPEKGEQP